MVRMHVYTSVHLFRILLYDVYIKNCDVYIYEYVDSKQKNEVQYVTNIYTSLVNYFINFEYMACFDVILM